MAIVNLTALAGVLKVRYPDPRVHELVYRQQAILKYLDRVRRKITGKNYSFTIETYRSPTGRFIAEEASMITPVTAQWVRGYYNPVTCYQRNYLTQESIDDSGDDQGSLFRAAVKIPLNIARDHGFHLARAAWYGPYATLGIVEGAHSATTVLQLESTANMRRFHRQMVIDVRDPTTGANDHASANSNTITGVDEDAEKLTVTSMTCSDADYVSIEDEGYESGGALATYAWDGIPSLVGTGNIHSVTTATYPEFRSKVKTSTGTLTLAKMQECVNWMINRFEGKVEVIFLSPELYIKYADILTPDIRYDPKDLKSMEGGYPTNLFYRGASHGSIPIIMDSLMPLDEIYFLNMSAFHLFNSAWMTWFDGDGSRLSRVSGKLEYEMVMYSRAYIGIHNRLGTAKMTGVTI